MTQEEVIKIIKIVLAVAEDFEIIVQGEEFTEEKCKEAVEIVTEALSSSEKPNKWIFVSERLPNRDEYIKNNGLFIVSDGNRSYSAWYDIYDTQSFGEPTMSGFHIDYAVTAWMPLPEPCKTSKRDEEDKK